jgi:septum formation topological specificity factor MinE
MSKDKLKKSRQHILRVIQQYSSRNTGTTQFEMAEKKKNSKYCITDKHNNNVVLKDLQGSKK